MDELAPGHLTRETGLFSTVWDDLDFKQHGVNI